MIVLLNDHGIFTGLASESTLVDIPFEFGEDNPQFTVTCITTGGPVGCVVWRRDSTYITNPNATSTLVDPLNSRYIHVLTVTGSLPGVYRCKISNNKPNTFEYTTTVYSKLLDLSLFPHTYSDRVVCNLVKKENSAKVTPQTWRTTPCNINSFRLGTSYRFLLSIRFHYNYVPCFLHVVGKPPQNLFIEQESPTSIQAHWDFPTDVKYREYGYRLTYTGSSNGSVDIEGRYTFNHIISGLKNGANYRMFIVTTLDSRTLPSNPAVESNPLQLGMLIEII